MLGRGADVAVGMGMQAAIGGVGGAAVGGAKALRARAGQQSRSPWEQLEDGAAAGVGVLGAPRPGFVPVPGGFDGGRRAADGVAGATGVAVGFTGSPSDEAAADSSSARAAATPSGAGTVSPVSMPAHQPTTPRWGRLSGRAAPDTVVDPDSTTGRRDAAGGRPTHGAPAVAPITSWPTTGYGEDIPPNLDPPDDGRPLPGGDPRGVDPITNN
jgi:hypothetical protein